MPKKTRLFRTQQASNSGVHIEKLTDMVHWKKPKEDLN